jgi:hypothetical protein
VTVVTVPSLVTVAEIVYGAVPPVAAPLIEPSAFTEALTLSGVAEP